MFRVIKRRKTHIQGFYENPTKVSHRTEWMLFLIFLVGLVFGAWLVRGNSALLQKVFTLFGNYTAVQSTQSVLAHFSNAVFKQMILLLVAYMLAVCAVGVPLLYALPLCYGIGIGSISAYLYMQYALKGIGYCALLLYPGYIVSVVSVICACSCGIKMSESLLKYLLQVELQETISFKKLNLQYMILALIAVVSAMLDTVLFRLFFSYFQFS